VKQHPLRVGLSMHVKVDLHDTSGPLIAEAVSSTPRVVHASDADDPAVEERIATIIRENASGKQLTTRASRLPAHQRAALAAAP
jgi:membrane fusion protein, multidrug efflux system